MAERRVLVKAWAPGYERASRGERGRMLDEFVERSGYNRAYAGWLLRWHGRAVRLGGRVVVVGDATVGVR